MPHRLFGSQSFVLVIREIHLGKILKPLAINRIITIILFTVVGNCDSILRVVRKANLPKGGDAKLWV